MSAGCRTRAKNGTCKCLAETLYWVIISNAVVFSSSDSLFAMQPSQAHQGAACAVWASFPLPSPRVSCCSLTAAWLLCHLQKHVSGAVPCRNCHLGSPSCALRLDTDRTIHPPSKILVGSLTKESKAWLLRLFLSLASCAVSPQSLICDSKREEAADTSISFSKSSNTWARFPSSNVSVHLFSLLGKQASNLTGTGEKYRSYRKLVLCIITLN